MKISVIVPNYRNDDTLPAALASLQAACTRLYTSPEPRDPSPEIIIINDVEGRGLSWARNRGLDRATGDYVFFCDADDTVEPDFLLKPVLELEKTGADFCIFNYAYAPLKRYYNLSGNEEIRRTMLPAFMGFGWRDVIRSIGKGVFGRNSWRNELARYREPGSVWRVAFRRRFLEEHHIRFDERLFIYEDAPFMCECVLNANRVACLSDNLYNYAPGPEGIVKTVTGSEKYWRYKRDIAKIRRSLNRRYGGKLRRYYGASNFLAFAEWLLHSAGNFGIIRNNKAPIGL